MGFSASFLWGAATAAYQIEGAACSDGKGLNIWDTFSHTPGKVYGGQTGDTACDHYQRLEEDLDLMQRLGLKSYRFSVSWARILPDGTGKVNEAGIDFYNRLIDGLLKRDIIPMMTLYHWDLPYALHCKGGWLNSDMAGWFGEYAALLKKRFGDRVKYFITLNEPQIFTGLGYANGEHAPGYQLARPELIRISYNALRAHGQAVQALRDGPACQIGISCASKPSCPETDSKEDLEAARAAFLDTDNPLFYFKDVFWLDPILKGKYPDWVYQLDDVHMPLISAAELKQISQPIDFVGLNIYEGFRIRAGQAAPAAMPVGAPRNSTGWPLVPESLYWGPYWIHDRYHMPVIITENGMACHDAVSLDGKVHDPNRIDFLQRYLRHLRKAAEDGVDVRGYFTWSLLDNFEWAKGYQERFGIVYVDFATKERIWKDSAYWYQDVIASNGETL